MICINDVIQNELTSDDQSGLRIQKPFDLMCMTFNNKCGLYRTVP